MKKRLILITSLLLMLNLSLSVQAAGDPEKGKALSVTCAACHGPDGNSASPAFPILAGQYADYLVQAIKAYQSGKRQNPLMAPMIANLSEQDIEDLAAYFASQKGLSVVKP